MKNYALLMTLLFFFFMVQHSTQAYAAPNSVSAEAAVLMEAESGRLLYGKKEHEPMRIASITKIMTAILAIESGKMDENVKISGRAEGVEGSSIYLRTGEVMKLEDLVYGLMLKSGNDAAVAIAEHVGGSVEGFVYLMNEKASQLGMTDTIFQNPHGLDDHEDHYSTAYDMAILTQYAMKNEQYQEISATKSYRVEGDQTRVWKNKNRLLTELYSYSTGGKTGFTKRARRTLVSTASKDDMDLICVTLDAPSDWHDHMGLFNWAFDTYEMESLVEKGIQKQIKDDFYKNKVFSNFSFEFPLTEEERANTKQAITLYKPPTEERVDEYEPPVPVGKIEITINGERIGQVPLFFELPKEQAKKGFWGRFVDIFSFSGGGRGID